MPISLRVQAVADEASFDRTADKAEKRFGAAGQESGKAFAKGLDDAIAKADPKAVDRWTGAYDKLRDATGKVRAEEAKLADLRSRGASDARIVSQAESLERARRAEARATRGATEAYDGLTASGSRLFDTLSELSSGTRLGGVIDDAGMLAARFGGIGTAVGIATTAIAGLAIGTGAAASRLYQLGAMWDDVADGITARTGKMGADLDAVMSQVTRVADQSAASIADIGTIAAQVSGSIGATGDDLGDLSAYIADLNDVTGQQTNIRQLGMLYNVFKVQSADQIPVLNELYTAYTKTQIPVNDLIATLVDAGPVAQEFKLTLGQTSGLLASFAAAGIKGDSAVKGLRQAMTTFAKAGQEPTQALTQVIDKIRELSEAGRDKEARDLAFNVFGKKAYVDFLNAIESGKVSTRQLSQALEGNTSDIREVRAATDDARQEFDRLTNKLETRLKPVSEAVFGVINDALSSIIDQIDAITSRDFSSWWEAFNRPLGGPWGGGSSSGGAWLGGGADGGNFGGETVRGTPGRGFPMPWKLDGSGPANMHGSHGQIGVLAQMAETKGLSFASGADNHPQDSGFHPSGQAGDFSNQRAMGPNTPEMNAFAEAMLQYAPFIRELIYSGASHNIYKGKLVPAIDQPGSPYNTAQAGYHGDHVHIAIEDSVAAAFEAAVKTGGSAPRIPSIARPGIGSSVTSIAPTTSAVAPLGAASSTPGYDDQGNPGYYVTDPKSIRSAQERIGDLQDSIAKADQRILDIKTSIADADAQILEAQQNWVEALRKDAETQASKSETEEQKLAAQRQVKAANDALARAIGARNRIINRDLPDAQAARDRIANRDMRDANEALAEAQRGDFRAARSGRGSGSSSSSQQWGAPIAADFGLSGGLAGLAENMTNFLGNLAFAPVFGALSGVSAAGDPTGAYQGAGGLIGMASAMGGPLAPSTVGGISPGVGPGGAGFGGLGGLPMAGLQAAAASLDAVAPGASIAANMGIQLSNRAIAQMGKVAGIGVGGLMETFAMPGADPGQSWFGRIAAGLAGAKPALPNMAGGSAAAPNNGQAHGTGNGAAPGPGIDVTYNNYQATEDRAGKDLVNNLTAMYTGPGW